MSIPVIYFWKKAPLVRILFSVIAGIMLHWNFLPGLYTWLIILSTNLLVATLAFYLPLVKRYSFSWIGGGALMLSFLAAGGLLSWLKDIRNSDHWIGHHVQDGVTYVATIEESLVEKNKSFKANATINIIIRDGKEEEVRGKILMYFKKDSLLPELGYGSQLSFTKRLQVVKNSGNPGAFDYQRYCLFKQVTHQVYLEHKEFRLFPPGEKKWLPLLLENIRSAVLRMLRTNISGTKEAGLAEALLIGYKNDLDKTLVQSYTNTGVVHIIAISGLHLGLIYWLLVLLLKPLQRRKKLAWMRPIIIVAGLWLFSLLAGAQPSILRSAVMFTCIVLGETLSRKTSIYNTLALSALMLLCFNPYWLWDVGFQLSYSAVLSIVIFMQPVYNLFYIKNKLLDLFWKINAVTIAAQILTLPVSIFHFHQFPLFFLLTNFIAVPLSSVILMGEILICILSVIPSLATLTGKLVSFMIWLMNTYVEKVERLPYSVWDGLQINVAQAVLLFACIAGISYWLLHHKKPGLQLALLSLLSFMIIRGSSFREAEEQRQIIVYNVPKHRAVDFFIGRDYIFEGDSALANDDFARNFHLKPARVLNRVREFSSNPVISFTTRPIEIGKKKILLIDKYTRYHKISFLQQLDLLIVSGNPQINLRQLSAACSIHQLVLDGSVPSRKANYWKKECVSLGIPYHDVSEKGAFAMTLN